MNNKFCYNLNKFLSDSLICLTNLLELTFGNDFNQLY